MIIEVHLSGDADRERALADRLAEALKFTAEYVGPIVLAARPGWSWFDALTDYADARGLTLVTDTGTGNVELRG